MTTQSDAMDDISIQSPRPLAKLKVSLAEPWEPVPRLPTPHYDMKGVHHAQ